MNSGLERDLASLREARAHLELLLAQLPLVVATTDRDLRLTHCSGAGLAGLGISPGQLVGTRAQDFFGIEDPSFEPIAHASKALAGIESSLEMAWGGRHFRVHLQPLRAESGAVTGVLVVALDNTEEVKAQAALGESEATSRGLLENMAEGVYRTREDGAIVLANPALVRMLGFESEEQLRRCEATELYVDPAERAAHLEELHREGVLKLAELRLRRRDGAIITVLENARLVRTEHGDIAFYEGTLTDITERKRLEEQLAVAQRLDAVGRLAGGFAHDFNNLLMVVKSGTHVATSELPEDHAAREALTSVADAAKRAGLLVRRLMSLGRREMPRPTRLDIDAAARDAEPLLRRLVSDDVKVQIELGRPGAVLLDPVQLEQILTNLVTNASHAMPRGGRLLIATRRVEADTPSGERRPHAEIEVSDDGVGMDDEVRARLFEPFFSRRGGGGTGLGLSTVDVILEQAGGHVLVESAPGNGTTFRVRLPLLEERDDPREPAGEDAAPASPATILVVDDEPHLLTLLATLLRREGYVVHEAPRPSAALALLRDGVAVDLLLTDVMLPEMLGPMLVERALEARPGIAVLYMTGYADSPGFKASVASGGVAWLQKPFAPALLIERVRGVLAARA